MIEWLNKSCMTTRGLLRDVNCCNNEHTINYNSELLLYNIQCILYYVYLVFCALGTDMFKHYTPVKFPIHYQDDCSVDSHSGKAYKLNLSLHFLTQNVNLPILKVICLYFRLHNKNIAREKQQTIIINVCSACYLDSNIINIYKEVEVS